MEQVIPLCKVLLCKKSATASPGAGDSSRGSWEHLPPVPRERGRGFRCSRACGTDPRVGATVLSPGIKAALSGAGDGVTHPRGVHPGGGLCLLRPSQRPRKGGFAVPRSGAWGRVARGFTASANTSGLRRRDPRGGPAPGAAVAGTQLRGGQGRAGLGWEKLLVNRLSSITLMQL